ncbi:insulin-like growth factor-binding protein complex acid labile subunit [Aricia agestis]|uniref:insulin-like growth factor-binding protein complex acid labile subunit n=1 Tax=Aricia agestis TaxID=91739 RepID=UPI001C204CF7|nr:insulin-like growth factor-binding protein complex acid labile subunit [Aricia agestis]
MPATLRSLSVRGCDLGEERLSCVLALVNATGAERVAVTDARTPLRPHHVRGLTAVRTLRVSVRDKISMGVPYDALAELPDLESFALLMANLTLEAGAGTALPRIARLELAGGELRALPAAAFARTPHLEHLLLWGNNMAAIHADALRGLARLRTLSLNTNALTTLPPTLLRATPALRTLHAYGNKLADLPTDLLAGLQHLEEVKIFNNNASLSVAAGALAGLPALRRVTLESSGVTRLLASTLGASPLAVLSLARNRLAALPAELFAEQRALQTLDLSYNELSSLPRGLLASLANLTDLSLRNNRLTALDSDCFIGLASLVRLDLSANSLGRLRPDTFDPLQQLQVLSVSQNSLELGGAGYGYSDGDVTGAVPSAGDSPFRALKRLRRLTLSHNRIAAVAGDWRLLTNLQTLDLAYNHITEITDVDMEFLSNCTVDLRHNNISVVAAPAPAPAPSALELRLADNPLVCDCRMFPLARALRAAPAAPRLPGAVCAAPPALAGTALRELDPAVLACDVADCDPDCVCTFRPAERRLRLACAAPPARAPRIEGDIDVELRLTAPPPPELRPPPGVTRLDLAGLGLAEPPRLPPRPLPAPRLDLDLRNNSLRRPPLEALAAGCGALLAGNPLACDCAARSDLLRLEALRHLVRDFELVRCAGGGALAGVRVARLCVARDSAVAGAGVALAALAAVLLLLWGARRHRAALRRILVKLGLAAELAPPASELEYDATVCFAPADAAWAWALVARLERAGLRLCVPERDWAPGGVIAEQVARSAARARLALVVVSGALGEAAWARLELAAAAAHGGALLLVREPAALQLPALRPVLPAARRLRADDPRLAERLERALRRGGVGGALGRVRLRPAHLAAAGKGSELVLSAVDLSPAWPPPAAAADVDLLFDPQKPAPAAAL